jgi:hypothetical protein
MTPYCFSISRSPREALSLLDEHRRAFPHPALGPEATVARVEALLAEGRREEAEREAASVLPTHRGTPIASRLSALLGTEAKESVEK